MAFQYNAFKLIAVCVIVYILQLLYPVVTDALMLITKDVFVRPWILVTSIFLHSPVDSSHLIFNMIALALFGSILERVVGSRRFLIIFFSTGLIASIGSLFFYQALLGASGAIMGVIGCLAIIRPRMMVWTPIGVPMPMIMAAGIWAFIDLTGFIYAGSIEGYNVANIAHLAGLYSGLMIGFFWRKEFGEPKSKNVLSEREMDKWEEEYMK